MKCTAVVSHVDEEKESLHNHDESKKNDIVIASGINTIGNERDLHCSKALSRHDPDKNVGPVVAHNENMPRCLSPLSTSLRPGLSIVNDIFTSSFKLDKVEILSKWDSVSRRNGGKLR